MNGVVTGDVGGATVCVVCVVDDETVDVGVVYLEMC